MRRELRLQLTEKLMKEALFYKKLEQNKVQCELCPHFCQIYPGRRGICGARENQNGILYSLVYGQLASANVDPIEKKPLFHFLPGSLSFSIATPGCNFRCDFCQNYTLSQLTHEKRFVPGEETAPEMIVATALERDCRSISYTYSEPTIFFEYAFDVAKIAKEKGLKNVFVTNGFINQPALEAIQPYLDAANVDLKSFNDDYYLKVCGGRLKPILANLKLMKKLGIWVEVTTMIIPGMNDSPEELKQTAGFIKTELGEVTPWHVTAFHQSHKMLDRPTTHAESLIKAREIGLQAGLQYVYTGNLSIPDGENTFCPKCRQLIIERYGFSVLRNSVRENKCSFCGELIGGVWAPDQG